MIPWRWYAVLFGGRTRFLSAYKLKCAVNGCIYVFFELIPGETIFDETGASLSSRLQ